VKRGGSLSLLVGTISNVLVMEIGWTDVGIGGYILVSCTFKKKKCFQIKKITNINEINKLGDGGGGQLTGGLLS
jgi:hypothetical protein